METTAPKLKTNLDTNFIKLVAIISMLIDHIGAEFFPQYPIFRWCGRLAFPLFCYSMTVGLLYTHNIKKYLGRLALFAVISQPFWILAFNADDFLGNLTNWNIFFTLFISLVAMWGFKERKWWLFILAFFVVSWFNFDYSGTGIVLMLIFYLCRNKPALGAGLMTLYYITAFFGASPENPLNPVIGSYAIEWTAFSLLAIPLIFLRTNVNPRIPKWFFYAFYPTHLALIALVRFLMSV